MYSVLLVQLKVKRAVPVRGVDGVLISRSVAVEPVGRETTESVTHGQCDAGATVTLPVAERHRPLTGTNLYCLVAETRVYVNNLPKVVIWQCPGPESNHRPRGHQSDTLPLHHQATRYYSRPITTIINVIITNYCICILTQNRVARSRQPL